MTAKRAWILSLIVFAFIAVGYRVSTAKPKWSRQAYYGLTYVLGRAEGCTYADSISLHLDEGLQEQMARISATSRRVPAEREGFARWQTPFGEFWAPAGTDMRFLLAEQSLDVYGQAELGVQSGDLVLDCGANIGTFTRSALTAGAERVIAIEPSPRNVYCLRQTFRKEIDEGKVVVVDAALWHEAGVMGMSAFSNSALDSLVMRNRAESRSEVTRVEVPLTTIDAVVADLGIDEVDYIKMDIEGAERNALRGAVQTITNHHPRMAIAAENLPDDIRVVPETIRGFAPSYHQINGSCRMIRFMTLRPEVIHFVPARN